ncbi:MAG: hypothetical protein EA379_03250 [Phycisphaerales bacterium]|nr:MAG: hypothetical protein EA379_03250 [Phycisphaerales bacterium]
MRTSRFVAAVVACTLTGAAQAQFFNIDVGLATQPSPSSAFGAASGQTGHWNFFAGNTPVGVPVALTDITGAATGVTLSRITNAGSPSALWFNNTTNSGDFAALMNDGSQVGTIVQGGWHEYTFSGLANGTYQLWTYAARPQGGTSYAEVDVFGSTSPVQILNGGNNNNTFTFGGTHAIHRVIVTDGTFTLRVTAGQNIGLSTYVNGFQLVPTPGAAAMLACVALVGARRRR